MVFSFSNFFTSTFVLSFFVVLILFLIVGLFFYSKKGMMYLWLFDNKFMNKLEDEEKQFSFTLFIKSLFLRALHISAIVVIIMYTGKESLLTVIITNTFLSIILNFDGYFWSGRSLKNTLIDIVYFTLAAALSTVIIRLVFI